MRSFRVILSLVTVGAVIAAPAPTVIGLAVICTAVDFNGSCIQFVSPEPFDSAHPSGCVPMTAPFSKSVSSARGVTNGYTCFLYADLACATKPLVISGQIPNFLSPSVDFNDKAVAWSCGSAFNSV
ncbi:hypothetical protein C8F01DRAFT_292317 [Mycena amicta]|nr:hypothetical protein C8F01DRAFT_292317 [Mycena amicta]